MNYFKKYLFIFLSIFMLVGLVQAQNVDELKDKIDEKNDAIASLEKEIQLYQTEITTLGKEKASLSNTIKSLDLSKKKLQADTKITENKIVSKNLEIKELSFQIGDKSERIQEGKRVIARSLSTIYQNESASIIESILGRKSFSDLWKSSDELAALQGGMQNAIHRLENLKVSLEDNKNLSEKKKSELVVLTDDLKDKAKIIIETAKEKNSLLVETKNTEANYNKLLEQKKKQKEIFEQEVLSFESQLKAIVDPNSIPTAVSGVLSWPLTTIRVTQFFGNTEFASKNPQAYYGKGHNGIDLAASIGTPVKSALGGIVIGSGNMDLANNGQCKNWGSYGKWILIKHTNGLSTLYAHLSVISAKNGQQVNVGDIIAYSGNTGTTFGPHLHLTVFASDGVSIQKLTTSVHCKNAIIPVAPKAAYLNPLSFLPY
jgi:murein DD-endopeptidase MepM/ murein hydrolase activator NlpD